MRHQCRVAQQVIKEHLFLLLHPRHEVRQLPYNGRVHSEQTRIDNSGPRNLSPGLYESCRQGNTIRRQQYICIGK